MNMITSRTNPLITAANKLNDKKYRDETRMFAFEGIKLFCEATAAKVKIKTVFVTETAWEKYRADVAGTCPEDMIYIVSDSVYEKLTRENAPQGIFTVAEYFVPEKKKRSWEPFVLLLDDVADPGNVGTIIRCADAFGADTVYMSSGCADIYNPKTVRACMGSIFRVGVKISDNLPETIRSLQNVGFDIYAATLDGNSENIKNINLSKKTGFVVGNEGRGISAQVINTCGKSVIIPMTEGPESLNAAMAAGILMWEAARVRL